MTTNRQNQQYSKQSKIIITRIKKDLEELQFTSHCIDDSYFSRWIDKPGFYQMEFSLNFLPHLIEISTESENLVYTIPKSKKKWRTSWNEFMKKYKPIIKKYYDD